MVESTFNVWELQGKVDKVGSKSAGSSFILQETNKTKITNVGGYHCSLFFRLLKSYVQFSMRLNTVQKEAVFNLL